MRRAKSKSSDEIEELTESRLNQMSNGLIRWLVPRLSELKMKLAFPPRRFKFLRRGQHRGLDWVYTDVWAEVSFLQ